VRYKNSKGTRKKLRKCKWLEKMRKEVTETDKERNTQWKERRELFSQMRRHASQQEFTYISEERTEYIFR
jgi:hypothetical protein